MTTTETPTEGTATDVPTTDVTVTVAEGVQVFHEGTRYEPGDTLTVPAPLAAHWQRDGHTQPTG